MYLVVTQEALATESRRRNKTSPQGFRNRQEVICINYDT
jgi:hypothetical protein